MAIGSHKLLKWVAVLLTTMIIQNNNNLPQSLSLSSILSFCGKISTLVHVGWRQMPLWSLLMHQWLVLISGDWQWWISGDWQWLIGGDWWWLVVIGSACGDHQWWYGGDQWWLQWLAVAVISGDCGDQWWLSAVISSGNWWWLWWLVLIGGDCSD